MIKATKALAKRRTLFAGVLALTIFGAVYGFAATLGVGINTLSAGNVDRRVLPGTGNVTGTYTTAYDSTIPGYKVERCHGHRTLGGMTQRKTVSVTLTDSSNNAIGTALTGTVPAGGGTLTLTAPSRP